jgi:hypothetical protein
MVYNHLVSPKKFHAFANNHEKRNKHKIRGDNQAQIKPLLCGHLATPISQIMRSIKSKHNMKEIESSLHFK